MTTETKLKQTLKWDTNQTTTEMKLNCIFTEMTALISQRGQQSHCDVHEDQEPASNNSFLRQAREKQTTATKWPSGTR